MTGLDVPLTPLRFLERAVEVVPDRVAIVDGDRRWTYREFADEAQSVAKGLCASGVTDGERVAYLAANNAELLIAHFAVPLAGGVLVAINTRLAPPEVEYICDHAEATLLLGQEALLEPLADVRIDGEIVALPAADGADPSGAGPGDRTYTTYAELRSRGEGPDLDYGIDDEDRTLAINYTSGTTGQPKGVMYSHRGAYLNALGEMHHSRFDASSVYLWTLPMFHCNGWCTTWAVTASLSTHVCIPAVRADAMWRLIDTHGVTHMNGAPTVLTTLATAEEAHPFAGPMTITTAGAPPSPTVISRIRSLGGELVHVYGLTETYGPYAVCEPQPHWSDLEEGELTRLMARQGVGMLTNERMRVVRPESGEHGELVDVEPDGTEMGEIVMRGNGVMKGYYRDVARTAEAFAGGWFHSGDLGVMHPDGYVQLLDRAKDVVVSGGENISTIEVEQAIVSHPCVIEAAVVGVPDEKWGERPKAFVLVVPGQDVTQEELIDHVRTQIAGYKAPREVEIVDDLPKTSTGKIRKNELRDVEWSGSDTRIQG